jgi:iron complex transport system ATP-binding protein
MMAEDSMALDFPGIIATLSPEALVLRSDKDLHVLASAVVGGGFTHARYIINRHVHKDYLHPDPSSDLQAFAASRGIPKPFVGLMTAVYLDQTQTVISRNNDLTIAAVVTAGLSNPAIPGLSPPASLLPGTINIILLVDGRLSPAAMVNAVITITEVKAQLLLECGVRTAEGYPATGTSTDAVVVACTGRGDLLPYAGPATRVGWLTGQSVRQALEKALT